MATTQHTPGAWKAVYSEYGEEIWFGGNDGPGMWEIEGAEAYLPGDHDEQARLIAAAPDLLAALALIDSHLTRCINFSEINPELRERLEQQQHNARAAIAKATGQPAT